MKRHNKLILFIIAASVLMLAFPVSAEYMEGTGYKMETTNIDSAGGIKSDGANYILYDSIGQSTTPGEPTDGANYIGQLGYIYTLLMDFTAPVVTVEAPNGGEQYKGGTTIPITWRATDNVTLPENLSIEVYYSDNNGSSWNLIITTSETATGIGTYEWTTTTAINSNQVLIRVRAKDISSNYGSDVSDAVFAIDSTPPIISNIQPIPGKDIARLRTYKVKWTATDEITSVSQYSIKIYLSEDGTSWTLQKDNVDNTLGKTIWSVPNTSDNTVPKTNAYISIEATDVVGNTAFAASGPVNIIDDFIRPVVTPEAPMNGEKLVKNDIYVISWEATDNVYITTVRLSYNTTGGTGSPWHDVIGAENLDGEATQFAWTVPSNVNSTNVVISIEAQDQSGNLGYGLTNRFTMEAGDASPPYDVAIVTVTSGETWFTNTTHTITWTAKDLNSDWTSLSTAISYSTDGGTTWHTIVSNATVDASGNGTYDWTIPSNVPTSDDCLIKIEVSDPFGNSTTAISDTFKIKGTNTGSRYYTYAYVYDNEINYSCKPFDSGITTLDDLAASIEAAWASGDLLTGDDLWIELYDNELKTTKYGEYIYNGTTWIKPEGTADQSISHGDSVIVHIRPGYYGAGPRNVTFNWGTGGEIPAPWPVKKLTYKYDNEVNYVCVPYSATTYDSIDLVAANIEAAWAAGDLLAGDDLWIELYDNNLKTTKYGEYIYNGTTWIKPEGTTDQSLSLGDSLIVHIRPGYYGVGPRDVNFNW